MDRAIRCVCLVAICAGACDSVLGIHQPVPPDAAGGACAPPAYDPRRYHRGFGAASWNDARVQCQRDGYDMIVFDANDSAELANQLTGTTLPFWVGVQFGTTDWLAIDGCMPALQWAANEPRITAPGACVVQTAGVNGMRALDCSSSLDGNLGINIMCETPLLDATCLDLTSPSHSQYAPGNVGLVSGTTAESTCAQMGTGWHVVEINTGAELDYVTQMYTAGQPFWVAATWDGSKWHSATTCPQVFDWANTQPMTNANALCVVEGNGMTAIDCFNSPGVGLVLCEHNGT